ncbi:MAG TPA: twin-arginine translocase TatA/TatE family subunit [Blastocatellia bacterium]|nr:twin-arginine translocase TatA/TatE family subunit [Blastocatellia bacterium]
MGSLGMPEILMILVIALIIFGPRKLPELGKSLGQGLAHFRKASEDFKRQWEDEVDIEKRRLETAPQPEPAAQTEHASTTEQASTHDGDYNSNALIDPYNTGSSEEPATAPTVEPATATVPREEGAAKEAKSDWM